MNRADVKYLRRVLSYVGRHKWLSAASLLATLVSAPTALLTPLPIAFLVDYVFGNRRPPAVVTHIVGSRQSDLVVFAAAFAFATYLLTPVTSAVQSYVTTKLDQTLGLHFRNDIFCHCQTLSHLYFDSRSSGDLMYRVTTESRAVGTIAASVPDFLQNFLILLSMGWVTFQLDHELALLALLVVPGIYASVGFYRSHITPQLVEVRDLEGLALKMVNEAIQLSRITAVFNREDYERRRFQTQGEQALNARLSVTLRQTLFSLAVAALTAIGMTIVLAVGAMHVIHHSLTVGQLIIVLMYIRMVYGPLQTISGAIAQFQKDLVDLRFASELLDTPPDIVDAANAKHLDDVSGSLAFDNVTFKYQNRKEALHDVSFSVAMGATVAIVGPTGAGKTTLISLLPRLCDPSAGRIALNGVDIRDLTLQSLRQKISIVTQEPLLFSQSIADNIRYGRASAKEEEVMEAARCANAHEFISRLPDGYETVLGERGAKVSGGERQRIAIARAFLKDAPILILDEPTASIDSRTEGVILDALDRLMAGRTTFLVAHRLSTIRAADWIVVLDKGRVAEQGTHAQLLRKRGLYRRLFDAQRPAAFRSTPPNQTPARGNGGVVAGLAASQLDRTSGNGSKLKTPVARQGSASGQR